MNAASPFIRRLINIGVTILMIFVFCYLIYTGDRLL